MKKGIIYRATNLINGKVYVGKTIKSICKRKSDHVCAANRGNNSAFHRAIKKYGRENFYWEILDTTMFYELLTELEKFYIKTLSSMKPDGYNLTEGGEGNLGWRPSSETKKKISMSLMGRKNPHPGYAVSEETKRKNVLARKGYRHSEETKRKISASHIGLKHTEESKKKMSIDRKGKHPWNFGKKMEIVQ